MRRRGPTPYAGRAWSTTACCVGTRSLAGGCSTSTAITGWRRRYVTTWSPGHSSRRPRSTRRGSPQRGVRGCAASTPARSRSRPPSPLSADGRPSSPAGPAPARPPPWRGCWPCWPTRRWREANACPSPSRAPTGKAASRLQEAVSQELAHLHGVPEAVDLLGRPQGVTLHRLLGWRPDNATRFKHDRRQPAQARRGGRRRVLHGRADDDGPPPRGAAARQPADPGRRSATADVGGRGRGARRPGARLRRPGWARRSWS